MILGRSYYVLKTALLKLGAVYKCFLESFAFSPPFMFVVVLTSITCSVTWTGFSISLGIHFWEAGAPNTFLLQMAHKSVCCIDNHAIIYASRRNLNLYISSKHPPRCLYGNHWNTWCFKHAARLLPLKDITFFSDKGEDLTVTFLLKAACFLAW